MLLCSGAKPLQSSVCGVCLLLLLYLVPALRVAAAAAHVADGACTLHWTGCCVVYAQK